MTATRRSPLTERFPGLAALPRASFVGAPSPVEQSSAASGLWVKRDDRSADPLGGNKVRALEFLLGGVRPGDDVATVGATGSTHALATALYARRLEAHTTVFRWPQEMHATAARVDVRLRALATVHDAAWPPVAYARAALHRLTHRAVRWIPAGGTTALGILGHVDAALELVEQVRAGLLPAPARVVVPLGTGGTAAGLVLGFAIAGLATDIVGVQVVPRIVANRARVTWLAASARRLLARTAGHSITLASRPAFLVERGFYGGAYGRATAAGRAADSRYRTAHGGAKLDPTYSAKACAAAFARCDDAPTLLWLTFDSRLLDASE